MHEKTLPNLLLGTQQLIIRGINPVGETLSVEVESIATSAVCPECQHESQTRHSCYQRFPVDLTWGAWAVIWRLHVKRFFCHNKLCHKKTFAERFPPMLRPFARQTTRARERQQQIALFVSAKAGEHLLEVVDLPLSDTTINRLIRAMPDPIHNLQPRVIGIDRNAKPIPTARLW